MTTRLESLKVSAELDASKYAEGARQKIAADQAMVDSAKSVDGSVQVTQQRLGISSSAVDRLARSLDPAAKSSANLAYVQGTLSRAMDQGRITQERSDQLWALAKERYGAAGAAAEAAGGKISDMREILRLAADTANGNMAGMARSGALLANAFGLLGLVMNPVVIGGAAIGAAYGNPAMGAAVGSGVGLVGGSAAGANQAAGTQWELQRRYDIAYMQCMYAKGNQIPVHGQVYAPPASTRPPPPPPPMNVPPPPSGNPPPPPLGPSR